MMTFIVRLICQSFPQLGVSRPLTTPTLIHMRAASTTIARLVVAQSHLIAGLDDHFLFYFGGVDKHRCSPVGGYNNYCTFYFRDK